MKTINFTVGQGDENLNIGDIFFLLKGCYISVVSKNEAIIKKLKSEPNLFKVINSEVSINLDRTGYICECLTTTTQVGDY